MAESFHPDCARCPRLVEFRAQSRADHPGYYGRAVPSFGPESAPLLIVGLAPGMHGANATGRPFTGDYADQTSGGNSHQQANSEHTT